MQTAPFDYYRPSTLDEAIELLATVEGARPIAGGLSLLPMMKRRLASPQALVDIDRLPDLDGIFVDRGGSLRIGALATHAEVATSDMVSGGHGVLAETAAKIGDAQVRNRGTIGGSVAHADPAADYPTVLVALGATITAQGSDGTREIAAGDFFTDLFTTALAPGEVVTGLFINTLPAATGAAYLKHRHPASSYAVVGVAAVANGDGGHMVVGGATPTPVMIEGTDPDAIPAAIADPIGDIYASGEYRVHLATVMAKRAVGLAEERAGG